MRVEPLPEPSGAQAAKPALRRGAVCAEERRPPQHQVGELARLDRADLVRDAVGERRIDRQLRE
jgi:hypothetical protein